MEQEESKVELRIGANGLWRWGFAAWLLAIAAFAALHAWHLRADFPNGSPWMFDWAKYTDEGWYGSAAARAHLFGSWYVAGDFNPAVAVPAWPFLEWVLYFFTGVSIEAARGLAVACFFANLALGYFFVRESGARFHPAGEGRRDGAQAWPALLAVTLAVTSPFLYCFSRLAILEPLQTTLTLAALNLAVRLPRMKRPLMGSAWIGFLFALSVLAKTTAVFLAPAVGWAIFVSLWEKRRLAFQCALVTALKAAATYGLWLVVIIWRGFMTDYKYFFFVNKYQKPREWRWPLVSFKWSLHGLLWVDHSQVLLAGALALGAAIAWRSEWGKKLWRDPVFGCSLCAIAGFVLFMTMQNHPQPRYFAVPAYFCFFVVAVGAGSMLRQAGRMRIAGGVAVALAVAMAAVHGEKTVSYALHPEYTFVDAAAELTQYIDAHPDGNRLLLSTSGDEITLLTHLAAICDEYGTEGLDAKLAQYRPGWYASWNDLDPAVLEELHEYDSVEEVAEYNAFDHPYRDLLVLFKLHPLPDGETRDPRKQNLRIALPGDEIDVPVE